jgi:hypothetical protein
MTTANRNAISSPATGLQVYDSTLDVVSSYDGVKWSHVDTLSKWLTGSVAFTLANTFYNIDSITLPAGVWYLQAIANFESNTSAYQGNMQIESGGISLAGSRGASPNTSNRALNLTASTIVAPTTSTVYRMRGGSTGGTGVSATASFTFASVTNNMVTGLIAVRIK